MAPKAKLKPGTEEYKKAKEAEMKRRERNRGSTKGKVDEPSALGVWASEVGKNIVGDEETGRSPIYTLRGFGQNLARAGNLLWHGRGNTPEWAGGKSVEDQEPSLPPSSKQVPKRPPAKPDEKEAVDGTPSRPSDVLPQSPVVKNGEAKGQEETKAPPFKPRSQAQVSTRPRGASASSSDTGVVLNGAPVDAGDTGTRNQVKEAQKNAAQNDAILAAEARRDTQTWASSNPRRREQQRLNDQLALDEGLDRYKAAREARIAANYQKRADARYAAGKLSNEDDWKNLGREGSNRRDYTRKADGETDEQFAAVQQTRRNRVDALRDRMDQMGDKTLLKKGETAVWQKGHRDENGQWVAGSYKVTGKNEKGEDVVVSADELKKRSTTGVGDDGLSYADGTLIARDGKNLRNLAALRGLFDRAGDDSTDVQLDALTRQLDKWDAGAKATQKRIDDNNRRRIAEEQARLRKQYGMEDPAFSNDDVKNYHESQQKAARAEILRGMVVAPGTTDGTPMGNVEGARSMKSQGDSWERLIATGFDPRGTFSKAMKDPVNKAAYTKAMGGIDINDPDRANKIDQLKHRFIMNQAMVDNGVNQGPSAENGMKGVQMADLSMMGQDLPGRGVQANGRYTAGGRTANAVGDTLMREADNVMATEAQQPTVGDKRKSAIVSVVPDVMKPRKKDEETQQAAKGGDALRPRRRR